MGHALKQKDNKILKKLAAQDQKERLTFFDDPEKITRNDRRRRNKVIKLLKDRSVRTANDYFNAALIFQHGLSIKDYEKARAFAQKSVDRGGGEWAMWLYAVATDRLLTSQGKKQKYGTQFRIVSEETSRKGRTKKVLRILPYDKRTSDKTRVQHRLPTLKKLLALDGQPAPKKQRPIELGE